MLKPVLDQSGWAALSPELQSLYALRDGSYYLAVEGMVPESEVVGLKNNTAEALRDKRKAQDDLKAVLDKVGGDPDKAAEAIKKAQDLSDKQLLDAGKIDELVEQRTERMRADHKAQIDRMVEENQALTAQNKILVGKISSLTIESGVLDALTSKGVDLHRAAKDLALAAAGKTFAINEQGDLEARDPKGALRYGKDPQKPYGFGDFADEFISNYGDGLWKSAGGGASKGPGGLPSGGDWHNLPPTQRLDAARAGGKTN